MVQLFTEVKRHKPSVIYIPNVDVWYKTVGPAVVSTFLSLLRTLAPTDPVLLLGIVECEHHNIDAQMVNDLFGFSRKNQFDIFRPERVRFPDLDLTNGENAENSSNHATSTSFHWSITSTLHRRNFLSQQIVGRGNWRS